MKRTDVHGARYSELEEVDLQQTVSKFIARWVAQAKLDVDPSLVTLRLVITTGGEEPTDAEEASAVVLRPRISLAAAGVTDGCSLLVDTVQLAFLTAEREAEAALKRTERKEEAALKRAQRGALVPEDERKC